MSLEKRRHGPRIDGIMARSQREREIARELDEELKAYMMGEPSLIVSSDSSESGEIIDLSKEFKIEEVRRELHGRNGDLAKRRAEGINTLLTEPEKFPVTRANVGFIARNFDRVYRFAKTLRNKGALHPEVQRILHL